MSAGGAPAVRNRHLLLLGAGHAHGHVLRELGRGLAAQVPHDVSITLVSPHRRQLYSGMVPGFVAGHYRLQDCSMTLDSVLADSRIKFVQQSAVALDAARRTVTLADGSSLHYDWLSLDTGPVMERQKVEASMPGAAEHALFVRPIDAFGQVWPSVVAQAEAEPMAGQGALQLAVVGAGAAGLELAMAAAYTFSNAAGQSRHASCNVSLITGGGPVAANYTVSTQRRVLSALKRLHISVLHDSCVGMGPGYLQLASGARLACDVPLLAVGAQAPAWLAGSGLALDANGFVAVNGFLQSISHTTVFAAGDMASRIDAPHPRSGVYAVRAGKPLLANLQAAVRGQPLKPWQPPRRTLNLLSCGDRHAIASWGAASVEGRWVWRLKDWIDRRFVALYR
ncbi:MAG: hypothetical protein JWP47_2058 [Polaromonas sp.]|jgi:pyridine nucleotide-disulfide oxidoreductase family protein|nr:hypothetical protein [Polaromonas sp.]